MLKTIIKGKVCKFDDNINTDLIMPGGTNWLPPEESSAFCMQANRPEFAKEVKPGDVIVAGKNFGCGSSRPAARNFLALGIGCAVAESIARTFFRSAVNIGFPIFVCRGVYNAFEEGDTLEVNFHTGELKNITSGKILQAEPLPEVAIRILNAGGVVGLLKEKYGKK